MKKGCLTAVVLLLAAALLAVFAGPELVKGAFHILYPKPHAEIVRREAAEFGLEEDLIYAVMRAESGFEERAESRAGARGLMQLTQSTFEWMASLYPPEHGGGNIFDPNDNIHCGSALLRLLLDQYGSLEVALCAYNAGMGNVSSWLEDAKYSDDGRSLRTIPYPETAAYVKKVKKNYRTYQKWYGGQTE